MTADQYARFAKAPLADLKKAPFWQVVGYLETCGAIRRAMILQALAA